MNRDFYFATRIIINRFLQQAINLMLMKSMEILVSHMMAEAVQGR